MKANIRPTNAE